MVAELHGKSTGAALPRLASTGLAVLMAVQPSAAIPGVLEPKLWTRPIRRYGRDMISSVRLPVFVDNWQIVGGPDVPPSVGDRVAWSLLFEEGVGDPPRRRGFITLAVSAQRYDRVFATSDYPTGLYADGLSLFWEAPREVTGCATVAGLISADWHDYVPYDFPRTAGVVASIEVENRRYVRLPSADRDSLSRVPDGSEPWYEPVDRSPKWFSHELSTGLTEIEQTGVLVILDVETA